MVLHICNYFLYNWLKGHLFQNCILLAIKMSLAWTTHRVQKWSICSHQPTRKQNHNDVFGHTDPSQGSVIQKRDYKKGLAIGLILTVLPLLNREAAEQGSVRRASGTGISSVLCAPRAQCSHSCKEHTWANYSLHLIDFFFVHFVFFQ